MKKAKKILLLAVLASAAQSCASNSDGVETNFEYEELVDTIDGSYFRNRKYDYARTKLVENKPLKVPDGLNSEYIKPKFVMPDGDNNFDESAVDEAKEQMLPPNYDSDYDMVSIIRAQTEKIAISVVYDKNGNLKLVFREPLSVTLTLLQDYFKEREKDYEVQSIDKKILSGYIISVKDLNKKIIFLVKVRDIDNLSSLVSLAAVLSEDGETTAPDSISEGVKFLSKVRKGLNNKAVERDESDIQVDVAREQVSSAKNDGKSGLGGLGGLSGGSLAHSFSSPDSYSNLLKQANATQKINKASSQSYAKPSATQETYEGSAEAEELS